jgi:hypothetical protein
LKECCGLFVAHFDAVVVVNVGVGFVIVVVTVLVQLLLQKMLPWVQYCIIINQEDTLLHYSLHACGV